MNLINPFSEYKSFNEDFIEKYKVFIDEYPYMFMIVEKELRNLERKRFSMYNQNLTKLSKFNFSKYLYSIYIKYFVFVFFKKRFRYCLCLPKFQSLFYDFIRSEKTGQIIERGRFSRFIDLAIGREIILTSLPLKSLQYVLFFKSMKKNGVFNLCKNEMFSINKKIKESRGMVPAPFRGPPSKVLPYSYNQVIK